MAMRLNASDGILFLFLTAATHTKKANANNSRPAFFVMSHCRTYTVVLYRGRVDFALFWIFINLKGCLRYHKVQFDFTDFHTKTKESYPFTGPYYARKKISPK